ncbi:allantoate amidohydrolase [Herbiconiux sp.]|uniref:allantoate amidohydrolase n=1 Tax=Herbiconiux sp. TaxID=1871186 RepID=UPI0025C4C5D4|nr:allantoate amidohydrolase [Herbiconiux sp.]
MSGRSLLDGLGEITEVGRDRRRGGWSRHLGDDGEVQLREWFRERAARLGLDVETDRNGNLWAWWGTPGPDAVVTGSHLDSVPGGGEFDGPLGVVSALEAVARLKAAGVVPTRPVAVIVFAEEEGSRFGRACLGSRLMTGDIDPALVRSLHDAHGVPFDRAAAAAGFDPAQIGADPEALARIGLFLELHVEQGRGLIDLDSPVAVASSILAHGRWRLRFEGEGNHAGATRMRDRRDPLVAAAAGVLEVRTAAAALDARATVGRIEATPGGTNVIASRAEFWLDARADSDAQTRDLVSRIAEQAAAAARAEGCTVEVVEESWSGEVRFDPALRNRLSAALGVVPALPSGAGHDAGILAAHVPSAMLFVRNPTGISHAPDELAELADTVRGVDALETVLRGLL